MSLPSQLLFALTKVKHSVQNNCFHQLAMYCQFQQRFQAQQKVLYIQNQFPLNMQEYAEHRENHVLSDVP